MTRPRPQTRGPLDEPRSDRAGPIALDRLTLSPLCSRRTDRECDVDRLADDIAAHGLLQNLLVVPREGDDGFEVVAGGRRLAALVRLAEREAIPADHPVACLIEPRDEGRAASLAENIHRVALNPADEFEAYAAILAGYEEDGLTDPVERIARCARHFGTTLTHVEGRLRLAPPILDALRAGAIGLDAAKAYAAYPDQGWQLGVFAAQAALADQPHATPHRPQAIRAALAGRVVRADDPRACYVGLDAYRAAGGRVARELFMGLDDADVLLDVGILERLYDAKAGAHADELARADGFKAGKLLGAMDQIRAPKTKLVVAIGGLSADARARATALFALARDGAGLDRSPFGFAPAPAAVSAHVPEPAVDSTLTRTADAPRGHPDVPQAIILAQAGGQVAEALETTGSRPTDDAAAAELRAVRRALPRLAGTSLEGRAFWPVEGLDRFRPLTRMPDGDYVVAILVTIPAADVEAARAELVWEAEEAAMNEGVGA